MCPILNLMDHTNALECTLEGGYVLHTFTAPGCKHFGCWVFEECHALARVGDPDRAGNQLAPQARLHTRAFEKCRTLQTINLERTAYDPGDPNRVIPEGCFSEAGLEMLTISS